MMAHATEIRLPPKWIELNLMKRECCAFIATDDSDTECQCGRLKTEHDEEILAHPKTHRGDEWSPSRHTTPSPTDAYGQIVFEGEHHPNKARFVRLSHDTNPELVIQLMTLVWGLEMPKLVITVRGGNDNFELPPRLGKILQIGLLKAAKSTNAWVFTNGLNKGVTKHIGTALGNERWLGFKRGRVVSVGISPWGVIEHRGELVGRNRDRIYCPLEHPGSRYVLLNPRHSNFLLVDNGAVGDMQADYYFRKRLERALGSYPMSPHRGCDTPIVCVVIEGGSYTLRTVAEYLTDEPPIPVVIFAHTGRTADLLTYVMRKCDHVKDLEYIKDEILALMVRLYKINAAQSILLLNELKRIILRKNLLTIYVPHQGDDEGFDAVLLASIFRSQHWTPLQQLSLTLAWDRVDIATNEVFVYGRDWSREHLEHAMMEALVSDRLDFVNLLLEHGLNMQTFLTPARLEGLYSLERTHSIQMRTLLFELAKIRASQQKFASHNKTHLDRNLTLHDVGLAMSHMMGHIYKSKYLHLRGLRPVSDIDNPDDDEDQTMNMHCFTQPFDDLFVWAVLTKRHTMALLLWCHGPGALAKSLVAVKLNSYLAEELVSTEKTNMASEFQAFAEEWETLSLELLDSCFRQDAKMARQLLTMELDHWSKQTCLTLAVMANHRMLLGHPCCQILLADLWMGALNIRKNASLKIVLGILIPLITFLLEYKSTDELKLLPHQERHDMNLLPSANTTADQTHDSESQRTYYHSRHGSHCSFVSIFQNTGRSNPTRSRDQSSHGKSPHPGDYSVDQTVNLNEVSTKLQEMKHHPYAHHHAHHAHAHFREKHQILDSGAAGSFIFDGTETGSRTDNLHIHHHRPFHEGDGGGRGGPVVGGHRGGGRMPDYSKGQNSSFVTTKHELSPWSKFYEFQKAPITNFYRHTLAYIAFVCCLAYTILVPQDPAVPGYVETLVICYIGAHGLDCIREFIAIDAYNWGQKWSEFKGRIFTLFDFFMVGFFMTGVWLRFGPSFTYGMLLYRVSSIYWNLRLYKYMSVNRFIGPKIVMMYRMLKHMSYFAMIILVVLIAFGIARESIRFPDSYPTWRNIAEAFLEPYVMMFGEVDTDALSPQCGEEDQPPCPVGHWIIPLTWALYMLVANILIVNVLIAVFNGIYSEVDAISLELWMFQRFTFVMEFEQKPLLPPPLIVICHVYEILRACTEKCVMCLCDRELDNKGGEFEEGPRVIMGNDHSLKTFLTSADANMVFDFEEDNVDGLNNTNEGLKKLAEHQNNRLKMPPQPLVNAQDKMDPGKHTNTQGLNVIKSNMREIMKELEDQRNKMDKLLEFWEVANEEEEDEDDAHFFMPAPGSGGNKPKVSGSKQAEEIPVTNPNVNAAMADNRGQQNANRVPPPNSSNFGQYQPPPPFYQQQIRQQTAQMASQLPYTTPQQQQQQRQQLPAVGGSAAITPPCCPQIQVPQIIVQAANPQTVQQTQRLSKEQQLQLQKQKRAAAKQTKKQ